MQRESVSSPDVQRVNQAREGGDFERCLQSSTPPPPSKVSQVQVQDQKSQLPIIMARISDTHPIGQAPSRPYLPTYLCVISSRSFLSA
jgi:hypothetical protein